MKLLICTQAVDRNDPILGFFHEWITEFAGHFEHVHVICLREGSHTLPKNVTVYSLGKESGESRIKYIFRFYRFFGKVFFHDRVDFVFFHMGAVYNLLAIPFFVVRKLFGTSFYWWKAHGQINIVGRIAGIFNDRIYTASANSFRIPSKKKFVVGHGIAVEGETLKDKEIQSHLRIVTVGRITQVKNLERVVEVAHTLHTRNIPFTISVIGPVIQPAYFEEVQKLIARYDLQDFITFTGPKDASALAGIYEGADILLHPSKTGSIDKVVLEAMSHGVVPIAPQDAYAEILESFHLCVEKDESREYVAVMSTLRDLKSDAYNELRHNLQNEVVVKHSLATLPHRIFNV